MSVIIRLKNLPNSAGASDVRTFFQGLKIPDGAVHIIGGDEGDVFVGFSSDEDARIAMQRDRAVIHGAEIRLLLSSKYEQNTVIEARKNGSYNTPDTQEEYVPSAPVQQIPQNQQNWKSQPKPNPYAATAGYEASYPPMNVNPPKLDFNSQNNYTNRNEPPQNRPSQIKSQDFYGGNYGGYKQNYQKSQANQPPVQNRFQPPNQFSKPPEVMSNKPPVSQMQNQFSPEKGAFVRREINVPVVNQESDEKGGDSWRDNSYNQPPPRNNFKTEFKGEYNNQFRNDFKNDFNAEKKFNQLPPRINQQPVEPRLPEQRIQSQPVPRKTLMPTPPSSFQIPPPQMNNALPPMNNLPPPVQNNRQFQNPPPQISQQTNIPFQNPAPAPVLHNNTNTQMMPPAPINQSSRPYQAPTIPPGTSITFQPIIPQIMKPPMVPAANPVPGTKFYVELTRLPNELLRPAALEAFIRPSTPLTLSSVKTVFGPGGIHMHTIIRLDSIADYAMMMRRNGEQGIKIQQSDKNAFETAIDGVPVVNAAPVVNVVQRQEEDRREKRSRWEDKSPQRSPRRSPLRRDHRDRSRSRSPPRRRRRSRSPKRRDEHMDPTRWCVQITNVPFRMKEEELFEWFSEKVRPAKLIRTYYPDGNASDRWVAEFSSESLMRRSFSIRTPCAGRILKLIYIDNEKADEIMKVIDVYGEEKRNKNENARLQQEEEEKANPPSFFNAPPRASMVSPNGMNGPPIGRSNGPPHGGAPVPSANGFNGPPPGGFNGPPMRGGYESRGGGGFQYPRGGMVGRAGFHQNTRTDFNRGREGSDGNQNQGSDNTFRGGFRGGYRGRGRGGGGFNGKFNDSHPTRSEFIDLVKLIGPRGTVLSCTGFPNDVTMEDVVGFFSAYDPDRNSIRIRRGDDGIMTGDCMLACFNPESAHRAEKDLNGSTLRNCVISVRQV